MNETTRPPAETAEDVLTIYTTGRCGDCVVTKMALDKLDVPYREVDIEEDDAAADFVMSVNGGRRSVPTLMYGGDATSLSSFTRARLDAFLDKHALRPS